MIKLADLAAYGVDHVAHGVCIGGWRATRHTYYLRSAGLTHVLKLYEEPPFWPDNFTVCDNPLSDGELVPSDEFERGVQFIDEQVRAGNPVLVQCGAGISRSSTFVLAYLVHRGYELPVAWKLLKDNHPQSAPHPQMWESLISYYGLAYQLKDVLSW